MKNENELYDDRGNSGHALVYNHIHHLLYQLGIYNRSFNLTRLALAYFR